MVKSTKFKGFLALLLCACLLLGALPAMVTGASQAPELSVVSAQSGAQSGIVNEYGYLITARDPMSGAYLDVRYDVSSTNAAVFSNLGYTATAANGARGTQFGGMTQFYVLASAYSPTTGLTTERVFGPFSLDTSVPSITITSGLPNAGNTYDSFTVSYLLEDTYSGVDLDKSSYSWSTSATTVGGYNYKFTSLSGSITTPAGLSGTQYLHMNVMDKAGHTSTKVIGPINMSGNGSSITFSGIKTDGDMVSQNVTINVSSVGTGINFTRSYYEICQDGSAPLGNKVYLNSLATPVTLSTRGNYTLYVYVVDNSGNVYTATSPVIRVGQTVTSNVQVNYSPSYSTSGSVTATITAYDTDGSYVTPITAGVTKMSNTTFQYVFTQNSNVTLEFRTARGTILQVPLSVTWITNSSSNSFFTLSHQTNGVNIYLNNPATVDYSRSYYQVGNTTKYLTNQSTNVTFSRYTVSQIKVVVYNTYGEKFEKTETITYLPSGATANLFYNTSGGVTTANMSWNGFGNLSSYPANYSPAYNSYAFNFNQNGYTTLEFTTTSGNRIYFDLYVDWMSGTISYLDPNTGTSNSSDTLRSSYLTVNAYDLNTKSPTLKLSTTRGNVDLNNSYLQVDGGAKKYFNSTNQTVNIGSYNYKIYIRVYNTHGDYVDGTFYSTGNNTNRNYSDEITQNTITARATNLDTKAPRVSLSTTYGHIDLDRSYYQIDGGSKKYFSSTDQTINVGNYSYELYVRIYNTRGDHAEGTFYSAGSSQSSTHQNELTRNYVTVRAYDLDTRNPELRLSSTRGSIDLDRSFYQVDGGSKKYFNSTNQTINAGSYDYEIYVKVYNLNGDYVDGTIYSDDRESSSTSRTKSISQNGVTVDASDLDTKKPILRLSTDRGSIDYDRSYFQVDDGKKYYFDSTNTTVNVGSYEYEIYVNVYNTRGDHVTGTIKSSSSSKSSTTSDKLSKNGITVTASYLNSTAPTIRMTTESGSIDLERSYYRVNDESKVYFDKTSESIDTRSNLYSIYVMVYNTRGDSVEGTFHSTNKGRLTAADITLQNANTTNPTLKIAGAVEIDFDRSYFTVNSMTQQYRITSKSQVLNLTGTGNYTVNAFVYTKAGDLVKTTLTGTLGATAATNAAMNLATTVRWSNTAKPKFLSGFTDGTIQPDAPVTRAQFYQMLNQNVVGGYGAGSTGTFRDLVPGSWYYNAVTRFIGLGVVPTSGTKFNPNEPLTRGEAAAILARLNLNADVSATTNYTDVAGHKYQSEIYAAARKGLISGYPDGSFKPDYGIRRAEAVTMINNAAGRSTTVNSRVPAGVSIPAAWEVPSTHWAYWQIVDAMNGHTVIGKNTDGSDIWGTIGAVTAN